MKASLFWVLLLVLGTALMFLGVSTSRNASSLFPDMLINHHGDGSKMIIASRRLKLHVIGGYNPSTMKQRHAGNVNLDDYHRIDPSPSSKASIKPGPIEHSAPIIPYIPKPSPPQHPSPNPGGFP